MPKSVESEPTMKIRMTKALRFCVECDVPDYKARNPGLTKSELIVQILREFEEAGDAMRFLNVDGQVAWKATPRMLARLADAEQDARDDLADW
jgi:hypothetical protein